MTLHTSKKMLVLILGKLNWEKSKLLKKTKGNERKQEATKVHCSSESCLKTSLFVFHHDKAESEAKICLSMMIKQGNDDIIIVTHLNNIIETFQSAIITYICITT
ncbi:unnamed protein product [Heterosigma akashiwo]